jgi:hypothetical protein
VPIRPTVSPIAYQFAENKIDGNVGIYVHSDLAGLNQTIKPKSYTCSAWSFPLEIGDSMENCVVRAIQSCFTKSEKVDSVSKGRDLDGIITVELMDFDVDLSFLQGFWTGTADAYAEMTLKITYYDNELHPVWYSVVGYTKRETTEAGSACEGGAHAISAVIEHSMKKITIQIAEKITSSDKLRKAVAQAKN